MTSKSFKFLSGTMLLAASGGALFASYATIPQAVPSTPIRASDWNAVVDYANKAVKQDSETVVVSGPSIGIGNGNYVRATHPYVSVSTNSAVNRRTGVQFAKNGTATWELGVDASLNDTEDFYIFDNAVNQQRLVISQSGSVGIGVSSPQARLDVNGSIRTAAGQNFKIRYGTSSVNIASLGGHGGAVYDPVNFGYAFTNTPMVFITGNTNGSYLDALVPNAVGKTTTGFQPYVFNSSASIANGTYTFNWVAIGE